MSSPRSTRSTPRRGANAPSSSPAPSPRSTSSRASKSRGPDLDGSDLSELAAPLPSSPRSGSGQPTAGRALSAPSPGPLSDLLGPGSVRVSEIDLSSPLNYGTPGSIGSSLRTGSKATPVRLRSDIQSERRLRTVNLGTPNDGVPSSQGDRVPSSSLGGPPSEIIPPSENSESGPTMVIWGTDVQVTECKRKFKKFINEFVHVEMDDDEKFEGLDPEKPYYIQRFNDINVLQSPFLNVNCGHIVKFDEDLYRQLICYPQEVIPTFDMAVNEMFFEMFPDTELEHQIQVRPFNADKTKNMRGLNPEDIDQLITISGMVIRCSDLIPELVEGVFKCSVCHAMAHADVERGRIPEPVLCTNCNTNHSYVLLHNRSKFADKQMIRLQESPDDMPAGQTPHTVILYVHGELVDKVMPGDRVQVTGVYRAIPHRSNPKTRNIMSVYKTHIDVVHFRKTDNAKLRQSEDTPGAVHMLGDERVTLLEELAAKPDIYDRLARAIAPSIYENEDVKKGILLQLFGGTVKDFSKTGRGNFRSDLNILLCGDPGTSKSQLLTYIKDLVPRSQYTSGKGSSAVGLTAYITKDPESKQLVLQTGALVLADNGICCIDEFDKMSDATRSVLHEVMEQQTLSIAKAGIICQLNARTSILAAANPKDSAWNPRLTIVENLELPATLVSRFDLIFLILDQQNELYDKRLARHLVSLYYKDHEQSDEEQFSMSVLRDYISHAKATYQPKMSDLAGQKLIDCYVNMRKVGSGRGQVSAYPRQLESLIRLAEAHARMRFSHEVEVKDVDEAYRLQREALKQSATDPTTGLIDVSILTTGQSSETRKKKQALATALKNLLKKKGKVMTHNYDHILQEFRTLSDIQITREMFEDAVKELQDQNYLSRVSNNIRILAPLAQTADA